MILVIDPTKQDANGDELAYHVLHTPSGAPVLVGDKDGYGVGWGDYTEQEAWARLPVDR